MPRNVLQTLTVVALVVATVFVAHNFVRYVLRVDGGYSEWTVFTECTKSCGTGTRFRTRICNNPAPRFGGFNCSIIGEDMQTFKCNMLPCPVDGGYGAWSDFGECSVTCGDGMQQRERRCDSPEPMFGGMSCDKLELGPSIETKECKMGSCPVDGGYGPWSEYGKCSVSCGGGMQERKRRCDSPEPMFGGKTCVEQGLGTDVESQACNEAPCPIDGDYTEWTDFSECTVTCGGGVHERTRDCTNPPPANGGRNCEGLGPAMESEECNTEACPTQPPAKDRGKQQEDKDSKNENVEGSEKQKDEKKEGNEKESKKEDEKKQETEEGSEKQNDEKKERKEEIKKLDEKKQ